MAKESIEKRKYVRFNLETSIRIDTKKGSMANKPSSVVQAMIKNMSLEGVCVLSEVSFSSGSVIALQMVLPNQIAPLTIEGEVKWCKPVNTKGPRELFEVGIKLFTIGKKDETRFLAYVYDKMIGKKSKYLHE